MSAEEINDRKLDKFISDMTLEEKVGQMFFVRCPDEDAVKQVSEYNIGGYILFGRDFDGKTKDEVVDDIHSYQNEADIPLLIGVDEEGGTVVRISSNPNLRETPFLSPKDTYADGGWNAVKQDAEEKADLLVSTTVRTYLFSISTSELKERSYIKPYSSEVISHTGARFTLIPSERSKSAFSSASCRADDCSADNNVSRRN